MRYRTWRTERSSSARSCGGGSAERGACRLQALLGPADALGHRCLGHEEGRRDLGRRQAADGAQGQRDRRGRGEGRVAAQEDEGERVVLARGGLAGARARLAAAPGGRPSPRGGGGPSRCGRGRSSGAGRPAAASRAGCPGRPRLASGAPRPAGPPARRPPRRRSHRYGGRARRGPAARGCAAGPRSRGTVPSPRVLHHGSFTTRSSTGSRALLARADVAVHVSGAERARFHHPAHVDGLAGRDAAGAGNGRDQAGDLDRPLLRFHVDDLEAGAPTPSPRRTGRRCGRGRSARRR